MAYQDFFKPFFMAANSTYSLGGTKMGGFLAKTAGTLTITTKGGTDLVSAHPVTAGAHYPLPFYLGDSGVTITLAGGASGTVYL